MTSPHSPCSDHLLSLPLPEFPLGTDTARTSKPPSAQLVIDAVTGGFQPSDAIDGIKDSSESDTDREESNDEVPEAQSDWPLSNRFLMKYLHQF